MVWLCQQRDNITPCKHTSSVIPTNRSLRYSIIFSVQDIKAPQKTLLDLINYQSQSATKRHVPIHKTQPNQTKAQMMNQRFHHSRSHETAFSSEALIIKQMYANEDKIGADLMSLPSGIWFGLIVDTCQARQHNTTQHKKNSADRLFRRSIIPLHDLIITEKH